MEYQLWGIYNDYLTTSNLRGCVFISFKEVTVKISNEFPVSYTNNIIVHDNSKINKWKNSIGAEKIIVIYWIEFIYKWCQQFMGKIKTVNWKPDNYFSSLFLCNSNSSPPKVYIVLNPHVIWKYLKYLILLLIVISTWD